MNLKTKRLRQLVVRFYPASVLFVFAASLSTPQTAPLSASPKIVVAKAATNALQFSVSARIVSLENGKANSELPPQTIAARAFVKGQSVRIETESRSQPAIFLLTPSVLTKLLPESRAGVRWKIDSKAWGSTAPSSSTRLSVQNLWSNPAQVRTRLVRSGAKLSGSGHLNGTLVDIYKATNLGGKNQKLTAWLRRSDALPLRVQTLSPTLSSTVSWSSYRRVALKDTFFRVPAGYAMRNGSGQPYL